MKHIASRLPLIILSLLPFLILWNGSMDPRAAWVTGILTGVLTLWECTQKNARGLPPVLGMFAIGFAGWTIVSFLTSSTQTWGFDEVIRDISCVLLFWIAARRTDSERLLILKMMLIALGLCILAGFAIYLFEPGRRFVGTFLDVSAQESWPNTFASLVLLLWPLVFITLPQSWAIALAGVLGGVLALSGSRGALLALVIQISIALWLWLKHREKGLETTRRLSLYLITFCVCLLAVIGIGNGIRSVWFPVNSLHDRVTFAGSTEPITERMHYANAALHMMTERPLFGWGPDSFGSIAQRYQTVASEISAHPHSTFLKFAAERGVLLLIIWFAMIVLILHAAFCRLHRHGTWSMLLGLGMLGIIMHNVVDTTIVVTGIAVMFWILAGLVTSQEAEEDGTPFTKALLACTGIILVLLSATELIRPTMLRGATELDHAAALLRDGDLEGAEKQMVAFRNMSPEEPQGASVLAQIFVQKDEQEEAIKYIQEAYEKGGWNAPLLCSQYLEALAFAGELDRVEQLQPEMRDKAHAFADALHISRHGVAQSGLSDEVLHFLDTLTLVYPRDAHEWDVLRENVTHDQEQWDAYFRERPKGFLFQ